MHRPSSETPTILDQIAPRLSPYTSRYEAFFSRIRDKIFTLAHLNLETSTH